MLELLMKYRPLTSPTSTLLTTPFSKRLIAPAMSSGTPTSLEKWLKVPNGITARIFSHGAYRAVATGRNDYVCIARCGVIGLGSYVLAGSNYANDGVYTPVL
jgi:hypothetical protein